MNNSLIEGNVTQRKKEQVSILKISTAALAGLSLLFLPLMPQNIGNKGETALGILIFSIILWLTKVVPPAVTSMLVIVLSSLFGILSFERAASGLGKDVVWLVVSMLIMGVAVEKTSLDKRLSYNLLQIAKGNKKYTLLVLILLTFLLTFFIPNAIGRLTVLLPIGIGIINSTKDNPDPNFNKAIILSLTFVPYVSTLSVMTGASGSIYSAGLFKTMLDYNWSYTHWMVVMMPVAVATLVIFWFLLLRIFPHNTCNIEGNKDYFKEQNEALGPISPKEIKLACLYLILISLWITKDLNHMPIAMSAVLIVCFLFLPGIRIVEWSETIKKVDWTVPLLFTAGFTLADTLEESGVVLWITQVTTEFLNGYSDFLLAVTLMLVFVAIRLVFTNYTAMAASLMPVAITFASGTAYNPIWLSMICVVASTAGYILPTQTAGSMTTFALEYYTAKEHFIAGLFLTIVLVSVTMFMAFYYWPSVGLTIQN